MTMPEENRELKPSKFNEEKNCCSICDAKKKCHVCGQQTLLACSECRINFDATVYVCKKSKCRDEHEMKCYSCSRSSPVNALVPIDKDKMFHPLADIAIKFYKASNYGEMAFDHNGLVFEIQDYIYNTFGTPSDKELKIEWPEKINHATEPYIECHFIKFNTMCTCGARNYNDAIAACKRAVEDARGKG